MVKLHDLPNLQRKGIWRQKKQESRKARKRKCESGYASVYAQKLTVSKHQVRQNHSYEIQRYTKSGKTLKERKSVTSSSLPTFTSSTF